MAEVSNKSHITITMRVTHASPTHVLEGGKRYKVPVALAEELVAAGAAIKDELRNPASFAKVQAELKKKQAEEDAADDDDGE